LRSSVGAAADRGETHLVFQAPWMVVDGTTTDPLALARELQAGLVDLGYRVGRSRDRLLVDWGIDLRCREDELAQKKHENGDARSRRSAARARRLNRR
jgi:hypothetical protein